MVEDQRDRRIAVVMITYNRVNEVLRTLGRIAELPERPRVVLVDNGSTDGTPAAVAGRFPSVEVVDAGGNLGGSARTIGVRRVDAPYVAFCDDDSWWEPGGLRGVADLFDAQPRLAVVTARVLVGPDERPDPVCDVLAASPLPREPGMPGPPLLGFLAGASAVRRSAFLDAGGFEPRFFIGGEEELLAADLVARGHWICYVPELTVHHHPSLARDGRGRRATMIRNALWFAWLRRPVRGVARQAWRLARSHPWDLTLARGVARAVCGLPWVLGSRRVLPAHVEHGLRLLESQP